MGVWMSWTFFFVISVGESVCALVHELLPRQGLGSVPLHQEHHPEGTQEGAAALFCAAYGRQAVRLATCIVAVLDPRVVSGRQEVFLVFLGGGYLSSPTSPLTRFPFTL